MKTPWILALPLLAVACSAPASRAPAPDVALDAAPTHPELQAELLAMMEADQAVRTSRKSAAELGDVDTAHTARLKEIVAVYGWPLRSMVGVSGSQGAFLIAQHADRDVEFQSFCLELMRAAPPWEISIADMAYLTDRVRVNTGREQVYGTQFHEVGGELVPRPIEDEALVDERRASVGLGPLDEYRELMAGLAD